MTAAKHRDIIRQREIDALTRKLERQEKHRELLEEHKHHKGNPIEEPPAEIKEALIEFIVEDMET